jgi:hypothetical protein
MIRMIPKGQREMEPSPSISDLGISGIDISYHSCRALYSFSQVLYAFRIYSKFGD